MSFYLEACLNLLAKSLSELDYEGLLPASETTCKINSTAIYTFSGKRSIWGHLIIDPKSIRRNGEMPTSAFQLFSDAQNILELSDITLSHFAEELHQSLFSEMKVLEKNENLSIEKFSQLPPEKMQAYLFGHPKILLNKGRLGFNAQDFVDYSPEYDSQFRLCLILIKKSRLFLESSSISANNFFFEELLNQSERDELSSLAKEKKIHLSDYSLFPVHPWQMKKVVQLQFLDEIAAGDMIYLKETDQNFFPQISVRTVSACEENFPYDLKLSLNILNTSAYRGISVSGVKGGPKISKLLKGVIDGDAFLNNKMEVLEEVLGGALVQKDFGAIENAPYRYHELLGFVLRRRASNAIMTGALMHQDGKGHSYIAYLIKSSKMTPSEWVKKYTEAIILPLYHLQLKHGLGLVSHGQNIMMKLENSVPSGLVVKDFQGDLRMSTEASYEIEEIKKLPPEHLIHDLITGHFVTLLRFVSPLLEKEGLLSEKEFYATISSSIKDYLKDHQPMLDPGSPLSLQRANFERIILNRVRFKMGYSDTAERLLPELGPKLSNPMHQKDVI